MENGITFEALMETYAKVISKKECKKRFKEGGENDAYSKEQRLLIDKEASICTFTAAAKTCAGDSGGKIFRPTYKIYCCTYPSIHTGPLVCYNERNRVWSLVGVASWGHGCLKRPAVHTSVAFHRDWIREVVAF